MTKVCVICQEAFGPRDSREGRAFLTRTVCSVRCRGLLTGLVAVQGFWERVDKSDDCWIWRGRLNADGYGVFESSVLRVGLAHRAAYLLAIGPIPRGLHMDHLCRTPSCVNPRHLQPVEPGENTRRGLKSYAIRETCKSGHDITDPDNVYTAPRGSRSCRVCMRISQLRRAPLYRKSAAQLISCPKCGQECAGVGGIKSHHYKTHGVRLVRVPGEEPREVGLP